MEGSEEAERGEKVGVVGEGEVVMMEGWQEQRGSGAPVPRRRESFGWAAQSGEWSNGSGASASLSRRE